MIRVKLQEILDLLEGAGYDVKPVPGIDWLRISASGSEAILVKPEVIRTLAETAGSDPHRIFERIIQSSLIGKVDGR